MVFLIFIIFKTTMMASSVDKNTEKLTPKFITFCNSFIYYHQMSRELTKMTEELKQQEWEEYKTKNQNEGN